MRSRLQNWTSLFTKLGFRRKKHRSPAASNDHRNLRFEQCEDRRMLATFTVNVDYDAAAPFDLNDNIVTLREAVFQANQFPDEDIILFSTNPADGLNGATILLTNGELRITESVTINASMLSGGLTIDASGNDSKYVAATGTGAVPGDGDGSRVLFIDLSGRIDASVTLDGLTITGGDVFGTAPGGSASGDGGGILVNGPTPDMGGSFSLDIRDVTIADNYASRSGGGIAILDTFTNFMTVNILRSTIRNNTADGEEGFLGSPAGGGGIFADLDAVFSASNSTSLVFNLVDTTVSGNVATNGEGGGVWFCVKKGGTFNATNSTISGNSAPHADNGQGGGLWLGRDDTSLVTPEMFANLNNVTITDNFSPEGGGLFSETNERLITTLINTIVSGNRAAEDGNSAANNIAGEIVSTSSYNLIGTSSAAYPTGPGNQNGNDAPDLGPLQNNGGFVLPNGSTIQTHAPGCDSPALNAGDPNAVAGQGGVPDYDQRGVGFERVFGVNDRIDIGAVELSLPDLLDLAADLNMDGTVDGLDLTLWQSSFGNSGGGDTDGDGDTDGADFINWQRQYAMTNCRDWAANSIALLQLQPNQFFVSTTLDEDDGNYSLGFLSLREAVKIANTLQVPTTILLPTGRYVLDRTGFESGDASFNDLDITGDVTIVGDGPGLSIIDSSGLSSMSNQLYNRAFHVEGAGTRLAISGVTITGGDSGAALSGTAVFANDYATLELTDSALVNNSGYGDGVAIRSIASDVTIRRSVFTNNISTQNNAALYATKKSYYAGSVTVGESLFALNQADNGTVTANVWVQNGINKINEGDNLYDDASGNFFNQVPGAGDHLGTTDYVVTTVADTFDHTDNLESLSLREAVDLANNDTGASEVWLPAWNFVLTRDRGTNVTDTDVSYGDLDIKDSLVIRGVTGVTSVAWKPGVVDDIFDLLGDFTGDGISSSDDGDVDGADYLAWQQQNGSTGGTYSADGDDDGDVDGDDLDIWTAYSGNTLDLFDVLV